MWRSSSDLVELEELPDGVSYIPPVTRSDTIKDPHG